MCDHDKTGCCYLIGYIWRLYMNLSQSPIDHLLKPVSRFIRQEFTGGIILLLSVLIANIWANVSFPQYHAFWEMHFAVKFDRFSLDAPLHTWINDGLMALFFFVIGLELKREFMAGELSTPRKALLPMFAALGGMLVPAGIYLLINGGTVYASGWGIPMATDIAFALALLSLAGKHIPSSLKVFLSALAVADDLGAIIVIAFFYTPAISFLPLGAAGVCLSLLVLGNALGIRHTGFYLIIGLGAWLGFLFSGVHATIAGVLVAFTIPARPKINEPVYVANLKALTSDFERAIPQNGSLTTEEQHRTIEKIKQSCIDAETPLQKIEYALHPWVAFLVMPVFALANSGMYIGTDFLASIQNPVSAGVFTGLVVGKFLGVFCFTWIMVRLGGAALPVLATWKHIAGVSILAGVGFTMSLFVTSLAFTEEQSITFSKYGILLASLFSGVAGLWILRGSSRTT